jgi:hypothetical protein
MYDLHHGTKLDVKIQTISGNITWILFIFYFIPKEDTKC